MKKVLHLGRCLFGLVALLAIGATPSKAEAVKAISEIQTALSATNIAENINSSSYYILRRGATGTAAGKSIKADGSMGTATAFLEDSYDYVVKIDGDNTNGYTFQFVSTSTYITQSGETVGTTETSVDNATKFTLSAFTGGSDDGTTADTYVAITMVSDDDTKYGFNAHESTVCGWFADRGDQAAYEIVPVTVKECEPYTITYTFKIDNSIYKTTTQTMLEGAEVPSVTEPFVSFTQPSIVGTTITANQSVDIACTENLPFKVSTDDNTYYYAFGMNSIASPTQGRSLLLPVRS